jgi:fermentation-respiration switch protein FrsA (DUF1100 family)
MTVSTLYANSGRDSLSLNPDWNTLFPSQISEDGQWLIYYQNYINDPAQNKGFVIHTKNKKKKEITNMSKLSFLGNNLLVGKEKADLVIMNLSNFKEQVRIKEIQNFNVIKSNLSVCYLSKSKQLNIIKYAFGKEEQLFTANNVTKYIINNKQTYLLYQKEVNSKQLYSLDLKTFQACKITDLQWDLNAVVWNDAENAFVFKNKEYQLLFRDLQRHNSKAIQLPDSLHSIAENIQLSFFLNNDIYISYQTNDTSQSTNSKYIDIWNGNARNLHQSNRILQNTDYKAFIYHTKQNSLSELNRNRLKEYLNIQKPNYMVSYNPFEFIQYHKVYEDNRYILEQIEPQKTLAELTLTPHFQDQFNLSPDASAIVYPKGKYWELYNFKTKKQQSIKHSHPNTQPIWADDSKSLLIQNRNNLEKYDVKNRKSTIIAEFTDQYSVTIKLINTIKKKNSVFINVQTPILFSIVQSVTPSTSLYSYCRGEISKIVDQTTKLVNTLYLSRLTSADAQTIVWTEEDFNQPPIIKIAHRGKVEILVESNLSKEYYQWRKQKIITYQDKYGIELTGVLYYPKNYTKEKKYPMVTSVYERQGSTRNIFDIPTLFNQHGYNQSLLNESGYFVFLPDTYVSQEGPGLSALECVTKGIEAITNEELSIDKTKLGLIGHSFGGYEANFIATQTDRFSAIVSGAGLADLIWNTYEFNYHLSKPNYSRFETIQYELGSSYADNPDKYLKNSPILYTQNVNTPILLWTGMKDHNVHWENTRHMFTALKRYKRPSIALFYKNVNHAITNDLSQEQKDLTIRIINWFDYFLKDNKNINWIQNGIDEKKY